MPINQQEIDRYWATEMGTGPDFMHNTSEVICTAQQLYSGVQLFQRDGFLIVASPQHLVEFIATKVRDLPIRSIFSVQFVERLLVPGIEKILGPAHVSYADSSTFNPSPIVSCRLLTPEDSAICQSFTKALSTAEIEQSGFDYKEAPAFGAFANGVLCAIASYQIWEPRIAHITVATHPDHRRHGYGAGCSIGPSRTCVCPESDLAVSGPRIKREFTQAGALARVSGSIVRRFMPDSRRPNS